MFAIFCLVSSEQMNWWMMLILDVEVGAMLLSSAAIYVRIDTGRTQQFFKCNIFWNNFDGNHRLFICEDNFKSIILNSLLFGTFCLCCVSYMVYVAKLSVHNEFPFFLKKSLPNWLNFLFCCCWPFVGCLVFPFLILF